MLKGHSYSAREEISTQESSLIHDLFQSFWFSFFFFFFFPWANFVSAFRFWATSQLIPLLLNELKIIIIKRSKISMQ